MPDRNTQLSTATEIPTTTSTSGRISINDYITLAGDGMYNGGGALTFKVSKEQGMPAHIYFKYIKKKFTPLQAIRASNRINKLEKLFYKSIEDGQEALSEKFLREIARETKETEIVARGVKLFIDRETLHKYKYKIRGGHISDTPFKEYTRVIPKDILAKKKKVDDLFEDFFIYHYWNEDAAKDVKNMSSEEKRNMKDPVLFGTIKESNRLYYIASWDDEYCDLTFDEIVDKIGMDEEDVTISNPKI